MARALRLVEQRIAPGVSTAELDVLIRDFVLEEGGALLFYKYRGFPANACISVNEEVVHGIPNRRRKLREGDIVSVDIGVRLKGYCGDSAWTFPVGEVSPEAQRLLEVGKRSLDLAIAACRPGGKVSDIGRAVQDYVEGEGLHVVKKFVGHGIGKKLHEDPQVPNYVDRGSLAPDPLLKPGLVLAIEPMVNWGTEDVLTLGDKWTVITADRSLSVHFEHSVAICEDTPWVLTSLQEDPLHDRVDA